jgi:type II secretory pathway pseudopilin PulG
MIKRGQIWIETVLYTLIGLIIIGIALALIMPRINEMKEKSVIEQTKKILGEIDGKMNSIIDKGVGNSRNVEIVIGKGKMTFDEDTETISVLIEDSMRYSEPDVTINDGRIQILTTKVSNDYNVKLTLIYSDLADIEIKDSPIELTSSPKSYTVNLKNREIVDSKNVIEIIKI